MPVHRFEVRLIAPEFPREWNHEWRCNQCNWTPPKETYDPVASRIYAHLQGHRTSDSEIANAAL